jgi:hypothetical protein
VDPFVEAGSFGAKKTETQQWILIPEMYDAIGLRFLKSHP